MVFYRGLHGCHCRPTWSFFVVIARPTVNVQLTVAAVGRRTCKQRMQYFPIHGKHGFRWANKVLNGLSRVCRRNLGLTAICVGWHCYMLDTGDHNQLGARRQWRRQEFISGGKSEAPQAPRLRRRRCLGGPRKGIGRGCLHPQPTRSPGRKWVLVHFELEKNAPGDNKFVSVDIFVTHM